MDKIRIPSFREVESAWEDWDNIPMDNRFLCVLIVCGTLEARKYHRERFPEVSESDRAEYLRTMKSTQAYCVALRLRCANLGL